MKLITDALKKEFSSRSLTLIHDKPYEFYTCQWQKTKDISIVYMIYRIAIALIFFITLILSIIDLNHLDESSADRAKWLVFLTHWGYFVCTVQSFLSSYIIVHMYKKVRKRNVVLTEISISSRLCGTYWVLFTIATDAALAITCIYWSLIFNANQHSLDAINIFVHGINSILMVIDLLIVAHPVRLFHCYWPFLFAVVYAIFNLVYYLAGGTDKNGNHYIYTIMDWERPNRTIVILFLALMFLVVLHVFTYLMFLLRRYIYTNYWNHANRENTYFASDTKTLAKDKDVVYQTEYL